MPEPPLLNNRYQIETGQGKGGMAVVYRARDLMLERTVAVKVLKEDFSADEDFRERFRQEARAAANLSHPNIVTVHDFGLDSGRLFIVMEFVPGTDLKSLIIQRGRFPMDDAIRLMVQACAGIGYAHRAGLVHCDVKPHNMLVTPDNRLKVVDFGIARALASIQPEEQVNVVWGSPQYFSPEQAAGKAPSPASDVYSLGVVLYEMLTGQLPFTASNATELARLHREQTPPDPTDFNADIPKPLEQIMLKVLSKEPSARYRTADQLGRVLMTFSRAAAQETVIPAPVPEVPTAPPTRRTRPAEAPIARPKPHITPKPPTSPATIPGNAAYPRPVPQSTARPGPNLRPAPVRPVIRPGELETGMGGYTDDNPLDIDWGTWLLALVALLAAGGLIPFWFWIWLLYQPPIPQ